MLATLLHSAPKTNANVLSSDGIFAAQLTYITSGGGYIGAGAN
jgi:hypothetical protein